MSINIEKDSPKKREKRLPKQKESFLKRLILSRSLCYYTFFDQNMKKHWDETLNYNHSLELSFLVPANSIEEANLMIIGGYVNRKQISSLLSCYQQMKKKSWVIVLGATALNGGIFQNYSSIGSMSDYLPIDYVIVGDPPTAQMIRDSLKNFSHKILLGEIERRDE